MKFGKRADDGNTTAVPKPYVLTPSGQFDGNDGKWSSFNINLGDKGTGHGQNFRVLISTSSAITIVPAQSNWCNPDCSAQRGVQIFNNAQSSGFIDSSSQTWQAAGLYELPLPHWWPWGVIKAEYGIENVGLGETSVQSEILEKQYVALNYNATFFMGSFGLANGAVSAGAGSTPTFLVNFDESAHQIPSTSYGYTAGASYRNGANGIQGSVVLGGYDKARVKLESGVSITMPNPKNNTLVVGVSSILYKPDQDVQQSVSALATKGFYATIDSTLPYFWLPDDVCDNFVEKFQLKYDNQTDLFLVNSSSHQHNQQQNATVTFKIGQDATENNGFTSIVLPYSAFDLEANYPLTNSSTLYFPLKRSRNGMFVLGRTLLQESYLIVDYERTNFTVAPAIYSDPMPEQSLVPIYNKTYTPPSTKPTLIPQPEDKGLSPGAVAGIVIGVLLVVLLAALSAFFWWRKHRKNQAAPPYTEKPSEIDAEVAGTEVKFRRVSELDSGSNSTYGSPKPSVGGFYGGDRDKDISPFPPISEMESPPAELYSPPMGSATPHSEGAGSDYFIAGGKVRRHNTTHGSSEGNTPGTPAAIAELPGDEGQYQVGGVHSEHILNPKLNQAQHARGPSDTTMHSKIDEVVARSREPSQDRSGTPLADAKEGGPQNALGKVNEESEEAAPAERRPSHTRGLSDTTVQSEDTAVSALTPDEMEQWALRDDEPRRPLSE